MKVLFLYNDPMHAWPALNAAEHMGVMGVDLDARPATSPQECLSHLVESFDVLMIHQELMSDDVVACDRPVVILERIDGAQLGASRPWIHDASAVLKGYSFRDPQDHNRYRGRMFAHLLKENGIVAKENSRAHPGRPKPELSEADLAKIHTWFGFGSYQKHQALSHKQVDMIERRGIPVCFAGTIGYDGSEVEVHRKLAVAAAREVPGGIGRGGRPFRKGQYTDVMQQSMSILCPYGWGEAAHRDYEAMLLGAVVIKPDMSFVDCWPNIYTPGEICFTCESDFSDVEQIVGDIVTHWGDLMEMRMRARELAISAGDPAKIAERFVDILSKVI